MKKAIVFAGGGSKGAYEVGAWKALNELGEEFQIAVGTSIGAINAAYYVQHDFEAAYTMWKELRADNIMANGINLDKSFEAIFSQREQLIPFIKTYINSKGADVTPFHEKIKSCYDAEKFFSSEIDYALMTVQFPSFSPVEMTKADFTDREKAWEWIAASCACFPVFPVMEIDGHSYVDGGYYDNIPVASAFKLGANEVVVIDLNFENHHEGYIHHPRVKYIKPSRDLGTFLNFDREVLERSIKLGYNDTMKQYGKYFGKVYTFIPVEGKPDYCSAAAETYIDILTEMEARFDFSPTVRFQRVNKYPGCTSILTKEAEKEKPSAEDLFFAALEMFMCATSRDEDIDYKLDDLLYEIKTDVDGMYPTLEYDVAVAFEIAEKYIKKLSDPKNAELKRFDEDRIKLIYTAFIRTLQHIKL